MKTFVLISKQNVYSYVLILDVFFIRHGLKKAVWKMRIKGNA